MNKISFIIPVFNEVKTVKQAIQEVVELNYENKEIVIIDNGSTDGSVDILRSFENKNNVTVYYKKKNKNTSQGFAVVVFLSDSPTLRQKKKKKSFYE